MSFFPLAPVCVPLFGDGLSFDVHAEGKLAADSDGVWLYCIVHTDRILNIHRALQHVFHTEAKVTNNTKQWRAILRGPSVFAIPRCAGVAKGSGN
eukprot:5793991-Pyramimonas_sp.AAC.1